MNPIDRYYYNLLLHCILLKGSQQTALIRFQKLSSLFLKMMNASIFHIKKKIECIATHRLSSLVTGGQPRRVSRLFIADLSAFSHYNSITYTQVNGRKGGLRFVQLLRIWLTEGREESKVESRFPKNL